MARQNWNSDSNYGRLDERADSLRKCSIGCCIKYIAVNFCLAIRRCVSRIFFKCNRILKKSPLCFVLDAIATRGQSVGLLEMATESDWYPSAGYCVQWKCDARATHNAHHRCTFGIPKQRWQRQRVETLCIVAGATRIRLSRWTCKAHFDFPFPFGASMAFD